MITFGDIRRWAAGPLDEADRGLSRHSDVLACARNQVAEAGRPAGWSGAAADAAAQRCRQLTSRLDRFLAGVDAARTAIRQAADSVVAVRNLVVEVENLALVHGFVVDGAGAVVDADPTGGAGSDRRAVQMHLVELVEQSVTRAVETDEMLASVLSRLTGDPFATSVGGTIGTAKPPMPGAPTRPATDPGAGTHGADPWYSRADDFIVRGLAQDAATGADAIGWTNAASNLRHYLGNSGEERHIDPDLVARDASSFRAKLDAAIAAEMRRLAEQAAQNGTYGQPVQFGTGWQGHYIGPEESKDWYYAMGGVQYAVSGVATVHPPEHPGGPPRIEMDYQTHLFDRYNWDGGKSTQIGPFTVTDEQLAELHRAGVAQEYDITGSSEARRFDGVVPPPGQVPELPGPEADRTGTRTDPGR